jgi:hypothetical protein
VFVDDSRRRGLLGGALLISSGVTLFALLAGGTFAFARPGSAVDPIDLRGRPSGGAATPFAVGLAALQAGPESTGGCATITGRAFHDVDLNGTAEATEQGADLVQVTAFGPDNTVVGATTTGAGGDFNLAFGRPLLVRLEFSVANNSKIEGASGLDTDWRVSYPHAPACSAVLGLNWRGTFTDPAAAVPTEIGGRVWRDDDCDAVARPTEAAAAGVGVRLLDDGGRVLAQSITDRSGRYAFGGLRVAQPYHVVVDRPNDPTVAGSTTAWSFRWAPQKSLFGADLVTIAADGQSATVVIPEEGHSEHGVDAGVLPAAGCPPPPTTTTAPRTTTARGR